CSRRAAASSAGPVAPSLPARGSASATPGDGTARCRRPGAAGGSGATAAARRRPMRVRASSDVLEVWVKDADTTGALRRPTLSLLRLFQVAARHATDDHREPEPAEPAEVLVEEEQREQRADDGLDRRGDGRGGRVDAAHAGEEKDVRPQHGAEHERGDVDPA